VKTLKWLYTYNYCLLPYNYEENNFKSLHFNLKESDVHITL